MKMTKLSIIFTAFIFLSIHATGQIRFKSKLDTPVEKKQHEKNNKMNNKDSNPEIIDIWTWQKEHAFVQGRIITAPGKLIFCAGQTAVDDNGNPMYPGHMEKQVTKALDNLEAVLAKGGAKLSDVIRMTYYVRDMSAFLKCNPTILKRYTEAGCNPTSTLIGVASLFHPDILFEVEATAVVK